MAELGVFCSLCGCSYTDGAGRPCGDFSGGANFYRPCPGQLTAEPCTLEVRARQARSMLDPATIAAERRVLAALLVIAEVNHAGERDPSRAEDLELVEAIEAYGNAVRAFGHPIPSPPTSAPRTTTPTPKSTRKVRR